MGCDDVLFEIPAGMLSPKTDVGVCSQMKYKFRSAHAFRESCRIQNIPPHQPEICHAARYGQETLLSGGKIVVANHYVAVRQKPFCQRTANDPSTTGNKVSQLGFLQGLES